MAAKKTASKKTSAGKSTSKAGAKGATAKQAPHSMPKAGKDPKGGLTAAGRRFFNEKEGSHLRPGVQGPADTPEKMVRKGSFLRRHFAHPRGPMKDNKGEPTRLALSAHAWGEPVPQTAADAKKLAAEGHELLEQYHAIQEERSTSGKGAAQRSARTPAKVAAKKLTAKGAAKAPAKRSAGTKAAAKKVATKGTLPRKAPRRTVG